MTTYVQTTHSKLFVVRKQQFNVVAEHVIIHVWQLGKKMTSPHSCVITEFFWRHKPIQKNDEH
jgi:hypothetical protein